MLDPFYCPICHSNRVSAHNLKPIAQKNSLDIFICKNCYHGWRADIDDEEQAQEIQIEEFNKSTSFRKSRRSWIKFFLRDYAIQRKIKHLARSGRKFLDVGCGNGRWLEQLDPCWQCFGVELAPQAAEIAKQTINGQIFCGTLEQAPWPEKMFDVITSFAVIEHTYDPYLFVASIVKKLKPGAIAVIMTGDRHCQKALKAGNQWSLYRPQEHFHYFSHQSLKYLLTKCGLSVIDEEWRYMTAVTRRNFYQLSLARIAHIMENTPLVHYPWGDHYYAYARSRNE